MIHSDPMKSTVIHSDPKKSTVTHSDPKKSTVTHSDPKKSTVIHRDLQWPYTEIYKWSKVITAIDTQLATMGHS